jgi:hypothetical protein
MFLVTMGDVFPNCARNKNSRANDRSEEESFNATLDNEFKFCVA